MYQCDSVPEELHEYDIISIYTKGEPEQLTKHNWYYGNITKEQAEAAFSLETKNGFLVRVSADNLVLTRQVLGWISHDIIHRSPRGYRLNGKDKLFQSIPEMIAHYQHYPIDGTQGLGTAITTVPSGQECMTHVCNIRKWNL